MPISAARQGLGAFGRVKVAHTLWRRVVPRSLLGKCRAFLRSTTGRLFSARLRSQAQAMGGDCGAALRAMLQAVRAEGGFKRTTAPCSASAFLIPKNQEKCRLILNLVRMNREVGVRPPRFRLPQIEDLREWLDSLPSGAKPYFVKVDLANAYWSLQMPRNWRRVFVVNGQAIQRLPFGWAFSPAVFQELMSRLVRNTLRRFGVPSWVYLDDVLIASTDRTALQEACQALLGKLRRAGFIVSEKSVLEPTPTIVFVGKEIDGLRRRVLNAPNTLAQCLSFLLRGVIRGGMSWPRVPQRPPQVHFVYIFSGFTRFLRTKSCPKNPRIFGNVRKGEHTSHRWTACRPCTWSMTPHPRSCCPWHC